MWSEKYNPRVCFDALFSTSDGKRRNNLENLEFCSSTRIALPGGGYIDLPGIDGPEHEETTFPSDLNFETTEQLGSSSSSSCIASPGSRYNSLRLSVVESPPEQNEQMHRPEAFPDNSGMRINLPGGGFINLPGLESPSEQVEQAFPSDVFQDDGLLEGDKTVDEEDYLTSLFSSIQSLEIKLAQKDEIIIHQERENKRLREHLGRFIRIVTNRDFELHNLQNEALWIIRDLKTRVARLDKRNKSLREKLDKMDATIAALISEAISAPLLRRFLEKGKRDRENLQQKIDELEKLNRDLMTKNSVLEHELTVIPNEIISRSESKNVIKAEVHSQETHHVSNEPTNAKDDDEPCTETTVSEQKTCQASKEDDPEQILVIQSEFIQPPPENKAENLLKKAKKVLSLPKWRRSETSKSQTELTQIP